MSFRYKVSIRQCSYRANEPHFSPQEFAAHRTNEMDNNPPPLSIPSENLACLAELLLLAATHSSVYCNNTPFSFS